MDGVGMDVEFGIAGAMHLRCGDVWLDDAAFGGRQARLVTGVLIVERDRGMSVDRMGDLVWGSQRPASWRSALRSLVSQSRARLEDVGLGQDAVRHRDGFYLVDIPDVVVDIEQAVKDVQRARDQLAANELDAATTHAGRARAVLSRPILPGVASTWIDELTDRLAESHLEALLVTAEVRLRQSRWSAARQVAAEVTELAPLREDAWRVAMRIEAGAGNTAAALQLFEECRRHLRTELGTDPDRATQQLHTRILRDITPDVMPPDPGMSSTPLSVATSPYVGLRAFETEDSDRFFGRDSDVQALVDRLATRDAVAVVGLSGVGKSSLVRAGLLPALASGAIPESDTWDVAVMRPRSRPLASLAAALRIDVSDGGDPRTRSARTMDVLARHLRRQAAGAHTLLVIDQAEELFNGADRVGADALLTAVLTCCARVDMGLSVVLTLRTDFYGAAARHPDLAALLSRSQHVLGPLKGHGLEAAIVQPARRAGLGLEPGLVGTLVADAGGATGRLPLLQHALFELWQRRDGAVLTEAAYEAFGGVVGGLARQAEGTWSGLTKAQRVAAKRVLLACVHPRRDGGDTRRPVRVVQFEDPVQLAAVDRLVDARLLTIGGDHDSPTIELAHEALIEVWPRLRSWIDAQRGHLLTGRRVALAADHWRQHDRDDGLLMTDRSLEEAKALATAVRDGTVDVAIDDVSQAYLEVSEAAHDAAVRARLADAAAQRAMEQQALRRLQVGMALTNADAALERDPELALLLCLAVTEDVRTHTPELGSTWVRLLHHAIGSQRLLARLADAGPVLTSLPDGRLVTLGPPDSDGRRPVTVRDPDTGEAQESLPGDHGGVPQAVATPDGNVLAIGDGLGVVTVFDTTTWQRTAACAGPRSPVGALDISPDGSLVAGLWFRGTTRQTVVLDRATGAIVWSRDPVEQRHSSHEFEPGHQVAFDPAGHHLVVPTGEDHDGLDQLRVDDWEVTATTHLGSTVRWLAYHPSGDLAVAHVFGVTLLDPVTLRPRHTVPTTAKLPAAAWLPGDAGLIAAGIELRRVAREPRGPTMVPDLSDREVPQLLDDPMDRTLHTIGERTEVVTGRRSSPEVRRWDVTPTRVGEVARLPGQNTQSVGAAWSPDGTLLATGTGDGWVTVWHTSSWRPFARHRITDVPSMAGVPPHVENVGWSADGCHVVAVGTGGTLVAWDPAQDSRVFTRPMQASFAPGDTAAFPDGHLAATNGTRIIVVAADGTEVAEVASRDDWIVEALAVSPDGTLVAATHAPLGDATRPRSQGVTVWEWPCARLLARLPGQAANLSFHPTDGTMAVSMSAQTVIWDPCRDRVIHDLRGHRGWVQDVDHSPDGQMIATSGWDGDVHLWEASSGTHLQHLTGPRLAHRVRFHPTRPWLAINEPGATYIWTLDTDELVEIAHSRVTRDLSAEERRQFLHSAGSGS